MMTESNPWFGMHYPRDNEAAVPEQPSREETPNPVREEDDNAAKALQEGIGRQSDMLKTLADSIQALSEQVQALSRLSDAAIAEQAGLKRVTEASQAALARYIQTNALPHDVIRLLQKENEEMIRKLEIRPQAGILRAVRDLYLEMRKSRMRPEVSGDAVAVNLLDTLMIIVQQDILEEYGVEVLSSAEGAPFKAMRMTNEGSVPTACEDKHRHVAKSLEIGFQFDTEVLLKERVALYSYDPALATTDETADEVPADEVPADEVPADEAPADEAPADEAPADEAPADEAPADEVPADEVPADEVPADEAPADEAPADKVPVADNPGVEAPVEGTPVEEAATGTETGGAADA